MSNLIATDSQKLEIDSPLVNLFELEVSDTVLYFHPGVDSSLQDVQFVVDGNTNTYEPFPMILDGLEVSADGAINRPNFTVANIGSNFGDTLGTGVTPRDLVGKRLTRYQTLQKYLVGEGANGSSGIYLNKVVYVIDRIAQETNVSITFEVSAVYDLEGITIPRRVTIGKYCSWVYQGYKLLGKGGCVWETRETVAPIPSSSTEIPDDDGLNPYQHYFDIDDRPLVPLSWLNASAVSISNCELDTSYRIQFSAYPTGVNEYQYIVGSNTNPDLVTKNIRVYQGPFQRASSGEWAVNTHEYWNDYNIPNSLHGTTGVTVQFKNVIEYQATREYDPRSYVFTGSGDSLQWWICKFFNVEGKDPTTLEGSEYWTEVRSYVDHAENTAYTSGDLVKFSITNDNVPLTTIWKCVADHNSSSGGTAIVPSLTSKYWIREEVCGKTLNSCKCRFQSIPLDNGAETPPSSLKDNSQSLPFGSFPGLDKF